MKYIDAALLRKEIEFAKSVYGNPKRVVHGVADAYLQDGRAAMCDDILKKIDSLQQEQPNKYETALEKAREWMPNVNQGGHAILIDIFPELGEGLDPRYGGRKQEQPEVDLEKEIDDWYNTTGIPVTADALKETARHFYGLRNRALEESARHVYESWMGGTMDDVRRDMIELGNVLNARKEE